MTKLKFTQIATSADEYETYLYALDTTGRVWIYDESEGTWHSLGQEPSQFE